MRRKPRGALADRDSRVVDLIFVSVNQKFTDVRLTGRSGWAGALADWGICFVGSGG